MKLLSKKILISSLCSIVIFIISIIIVIIGFILNNDIIFYIGIGVLSVAAIYLALMILYILRLILLKIGG